MDSALRWLDGEKPIEVEIVAYNTTALRFYQTFGFVVDPTRRQASDEDWNVLPSGTRLPVVFMVKPGAQKFWDDRRSRDASDRSS
jgi:hypothetical protein